MIPTPSADLAPYHDLLNGMLARLPSQTRWQLRQDLERMAHVSRVTHEAIWQMGEAQVSTHMQLAKTMTILETIERATPALTPQEKAYLARIRQQGFSAANEALNELYGALLVIIQDSAAPPQPAPRSTSASALKPFTLLCWTALASAGLILLLASPVTFLILAVLTGIVYVGLND